MQLPVGNQLPSINYQVTSKKKSITKNQLPISNQLPKINYQITSKKKQLPSINYQLVNNYQVPITY